MKSIQVYDSTYEMLEKVSEKYDLSMAEVVEQFLMDEQDIREALEDDEK